jgi:hypothetical protein
MNFIISIYKYKVNKIYKFFMYTKEFMYRMSGYKIKLYFFIASKRLN